MKLNLLTKYILYINKINIEIKKIYLLKILEIVTIVTEKKGNI